ncbi:hypothetical protein DP117_00435 [Brasilonema sp. UFV-L1]|nr:hypothetical protein [Brasilonema sp. UFV-L1]
MCHLPFILQFWCELDFVAASSLIQTPSLPRGGFKSFCIHSSDIHVVGMQIVNTPSKARKDFYSRIERFNVF